MTPQQQSIIEQIQLNPKLNAILRPEDPLPEPYHSGKPVKAIVLGADPSTPEQDIVFEKVFGLEKTDNPYFRSIAKNLEMIGLLLDDVYVQNLVQNYWQVLADLWRGELIRELDEKFNRDVPVLITAGKLYFALTNQPEKRSFKFSQLYGEPFCISPSANLLGRKIFPLFRNLSYRLDLPKWITYLQFVRHEFDVNKT